MNNDLKFPAYEDQTMLEDHVTVAGDIGNFFFRKLNFNSNLEIYLEKHSK